MTFGNISDMDFRFVVIFVSFFFPSVTLVHFCQNPAGQVITFAQEALGKSFLVDGKMSGPNLGETRAPQAVGINSKEDFFKMAKIA